MIKTVGIAAMGALILSGAAHAQDKQSGFSRNIGASAATSCFIDAQSMFRLTLQYQSQRYKMLQNNQLPPQSLMGLERISDQSTRNKDTLCIEGLKPYKDLVKNWAQLTASLYHNESVLSANVAAIYNKTGSVYLHMNDPASAKKYLDAVPDFEKDAEMSQGFADAVMSRPSPHSPPNNQ